MRELKQTQAMYFLQCGSKLESRTTMDSRTEPGDIYG